MPTVDIPTHGDNDRVHRGQRPKNRGKSRVFAVPTPSVSEDTTLTVRTSRKPAEMLEKSSLSSVSPPSARCIQRKGSDLSPDWWSASDWQAYRDDLIFRLITDGASHHQAQTEAYGGSDGYVELMPFGAGKSGIVWLHNNCWPPWHRERIKTAEAALATCAIVKPPEPS